MFVKVRKLGLGSSTPSVYVYFRVCNALGFHCFQSFTPSVCVCFCVCNTVADPGGVAGMGLRPPQRYPIYSFSHKFLPKSTCVGGRRCPPKQVGTPPTGNPRSAAAMHLASIVFNGAIHTKRW